MGGNSQILLMTEGQTWNIQATALELTPTELLHRNYGVGCGITRSWDFLVIRWVINPSANVGVTGSIPGPEDTTRGRAPKPVCHKVLGPCSRAHARQQERPLKMRSSSTTTRDSPCFPQLGKAASATKIQCS